MIKNSRDVLSIGPVIPVVTIDDKAVAVDIARALVEGGVRTIEITLRTSLALNAIEDIARYVPDIVVGAGTILTLGDIERARSAGAQFGVSPGCTQQLFPAIKDFPFLPGAVTASEIMAALAAGFTTLKFFPAKTSGGPDAVRQFAPVFPDVIFCPTGGIGLADAPLWLDLPNVLCVGGSWITPQSAIRSRDWASIKANAGRAAALVRSSTTD
jgi:2-dehydro-3-deoxyphosphogluconate aldolase/(4S)-4-hydroxy-2-oxoglutarate aldolase